MKLSMMLNRENPKVLRVPISRPRRATAAYIVFIAAKLLPHSHNERNEDVHWFPAESRKRSVLRNTLFPRWRITRECGPH